MLKIAVIGFGYWGKNLVRNFYNLPGATLAYIVEADPTRRAKAQELYPTVTTLASPSELYKDASLDAVVIATPVFTHYELAKEALLHDRHVLVEKPMTAKAKQAAELLELAAQKNKVLMTDHTFLYTGAVQKIKEIVDSGSLGKMLYVDSTRVNLGLFQPDINVLWDLAPHDISICEHIIAEKPYSVQATGISHLKNGLENIAYLTVNYPSDFIAHFNCSWTSPVKIRMMLIGGDKKMIVYNDMEPTEKIKVYDSGFVVKGEQEEEALTKIRVDYRVGDIYVPKLAVQEALRELAIDFTSSISRGTTPISSAYLGLTVVQTLEAAEQSIRNGGIEIKLDSLL